MSESTRPVFSDRYEIHSRIGRGGMADVFLAKDLLLDRPVAIKVLFPEFAADPSFVERFRREAQSAANLTHPNVVAVYDWGQEGSTYFIVMEYVKGRTLADILRRDGSLDPDRAFGITADVAAALGIAHRNGLVHRDVKPGNILVASNGEVKVADFGISRAMNAATDADLTQAGAVMGTATYFSPEQAQGLTPDPRSDLYSLGIVMYEMVTGQPPFTGENPVAIAYKQVHEMPTAPSRVNPAVPQSYEKVVRRLLQKDPSKRYQTAEELRADLRRIRDGGDADPVAAARALPMDTPPMAQPRVSPTAATTAMPTAAAAQRGAWAYGDTQAIPVTRSNPQAPHPDYVAPPPPPPRTGLWAALALVGVIAVAIVSIVLWNSLRSDSPSAATQVAVENVTGRTQVEAEDVLKAQGLAPEVVLEQSAPEQAGLVIAQNPAAGSLVEAGSKVTFRVGQGQGTVEIPDFTGQLQVDAENALKNLGLVPQIEEREDDTVAKGIVLEQNPIGPAAAGSTVRLVVSIGKGEATIDDVTGLSEIDAVKLLSKNFEVENQTEASDTVPEGFVIRTDPPAGTPVEKGSVVALFVSSGPEPTAVPDVRGRTETDARNILAQAGFDNVQVINVETTDPAQIGLVVTQSPLPGTTISKNDTVSINVARSVATTTTVATATTLPPTTTTTPPETTTSTTVPEETTTTTVGP